MGLTGLIQPQAGVGLEVSYRSPCPPRSLGILGLSEL